MGEHPEDFCDECGGRNIVWSAPNDVWNQVTGHPAGLILCPVCFVRRADAAGFRDCWTLVPDALLPEPAFTAEAAQRYLDTQAWLAERADA